MVSYNIEKVNTVLKRTAFMFPHLSLIDKIARPMFSCAYGAGKGLSMLLDQLLPGGSEGFGPGDYLPSVRVHERFSACL